MQEAMVLFVLWDVGGSGNVLCWAKTNDIFFKLFGDWLPLLMMT